MVEICKGSQFSLVRLCWLDFEQQKMMIMMMTIEGPELGNPGGGDKDELLSLSLFSVERREWSRLWSWRVEGEAGGFATRW